MQIVPNPDHLMQVAVIDPKLMYGQPGQYVSQKGDKVEMLRLAEEGVANGREVRLYYKNLTTSSGEKVASQLIITHIPPGHVQPFHTHHRLHEYTIVAVGEIIAVDSDWLTEVDVEGIKVAGQRMVVGDLVVEDPGQRHTLMNPGPGFATTYTTQTARIRLEEFPHDWERDRPVEQRQAA